RLERFRLVRDLAALVDADGPVAGEFDRPAVIAFGDICLREGGAYVVRGDGRAFDGLACLEETSLRFLLRLEPGRFVLLEQRPLALAAFRADPRGGGGLRGSFEPSLKSLLRGL